MQSMQKSRIRFWWSFKIALKTLPTSQQMSTTIRTRKHMLCRLTWPTYSLKASSYVACKRRSSSMTPWRTISMIQTQIWPRPSSFTQRVATRASVQLQRLLMPTLRTCKTTRARCWYRTPTLASKASSIRSECFGPLKTWMATLKTDYWPT